MHLPIFNHSKQTYRNTNFQTKILVDKTLMQAHNRRWLASIINNIMYGNVSKILLVRYHLFQPTWWPNSLIVYWWVVCRRRRFSRKQWLMNMVFVFRVWIWNCIADYVLHDFLSMFPKLCSQNDLCAADKAVVGQ